MVNEDTKYYREKPKEDEDYIKPLASEAAFMKGVEYFSEIFFFYGLIFAVTTWEMKKAYE